MGGGNLWLDSAFAESKVWLNHFFCCPLNIVCEDVDVWSSSVFLSHFFDEILHSSDGELLIGRQMHGGLGEVASSYVNAYVELRSICRTTGKESVLRDEHRVAATANSMHDFGTAQVPEIFERL